MNRLATIIVAAAITASVAHTFLISAAAGERSASVTPSWAPTLSSSPLPASARGSCNTTCPPIATVECEPCGIDLNPGCAGVGPKPQVIQVGDTLCGTFWADGGTRDTDFYRFTTLGGTVTFNVQSNISAICFILDNNCPANIIATGQGDCPDGLTASATLEPGDYQLFIAPAAFDGYPCSGDTTYTATLTASTPPASCPADLSNNGSVEVTDLLMLLNDWGPCKSDPPPPCPNGTWINNFPIGFDCDATYSFSCIEGWTFEQDDTTLTVTSIGCGDPITMTGEASFCLLGYILSVTQSKGGHCQVTYSLTGHFTTDDQFLGEFSVQYNENCTCDCIPINNLLFTATRQ